MAWRAVVWREAGGDGGGGDGGRSRSLRPRKAAPLEARPHFRSSVRAVRKQRDVIDQDRCVTGVAVVMITEPERCLCAVK